MAVNEPVVQVLQAMPPATLYATEDVRLGGSTPAESVHVWDFDDSVIEYMDFLCVLRGYGGGGLTFTLAWMATSAITGAVVLSMAIRRLVSDAEDVDSSHTYDFNDTNMLSPPSASGEIVYSTISFTDGLDMDDWSEGEMAIVRVRRLATSGGDDMVGDVELLGIEGRETA